MNIRTLFAAGFCLAVGSASAQTLYSTNFDGLAPGALNGQDGWQATSNDVIVTGAVSGVTPFSGSQMVQFPSAPDGDSVYAWRDVAAAWAARDAWHTVARGSTRLYIPEAVQPEYEFGIAAYSGNTWLGEVLANTETNTLWVYTPMLGGVFDTGMVFERNQWNLLQLQLDYATGLLTASLNGVGIGQNASFDSAAGFTDFNMAGYTLDGVAGVSAYYDDFQVHAVPEPATMAVLAAGAGALALRRRRQSV